MFGITAFSQLPFSTQGASIYEVSATVAAESEVAVNVALVGNASGTIAGASGLSAAGVRYAFGQALIASQSEITGNTKVIINVPVLIVGESSVVIFTNRITSSSSTMAGASSIIAQAVLKWQQNADTAEVWTEVPDTSEIWTPVSDTGETWSRVH